MKKMRRASVAVVPLLLAVMILFWFIWTLGFEGDNLHRINEVQNLQHLQESLVVPAMKRRYELAKANPQMSEEELRVAVDAYIDEIMVVNKIHR
jgi:hypothetical protein